jgi:hypothetical protein
MLRQLSLHLLPSLRAAWLIKALGTIPAQEPEVGMFSSLAFAVGLAFALGLAIVVMLVAKAGPDETIAAVLYNAERPEKTR